MSERIHLCGIRKAAKANIPVWGCDDLGLDPSLVGTSGSMVSWQSTIPPLRKANVEMIEGNPKDAAKILVDRLIDQKVL